MLQLHMNTTVESIRLFLPDMLTRKHGGDHHSGLRRRILSHSYITEYAATKAFLIAFSEGLARETQNQGINHTSLLPGIYRHRFPSNCRASTQHVLFPQSAQQVVETSLHALQTKRTLVTIGWQGRLSLWVSKLIPHKILMAFAGKAVKPPVASKKQ